MPKALERKARFFARQKMRHESSKKVNVFARAATAFRKIIILGILEGEYL
jgi:hypothetical protein